MSSLAPLLEAFFTERLIGQRGASSHQVAAYRDAFCLLLRFAQRRTGRAPHQLALEDLDAALIGAFLNHLEAERRVTVRTRNARLTAIRALFHPTARSNRRADPGQPARCSPPGPARRTHPRVPRRRHDRSRVSDPHGLPSATRRSCVRH